WARPLRRQAAKTEPGSGDGDERDDGDGQPGRHEQRGDATDQWIVDLDRADLIAENEVLRALPDEKSGQCDNEGRRADDDDPEALHEPDQRAEAERRDDP